MRRTPLSSFLILPAILAMAAAVPSAATHAGAIAFSGHVLDPNTSLVPGSIVTIHGAVIARANACIEAHVEIPAHPHASMLWLCASDARGASRLPDIGEPVAARARITGVKTTRAGTIPRSDSFILLDAK